MIVLVYLALGTMFAVRTPSWQTPDESSHYLYVEKIAIDHQFPTVDLAHSGYYEAVQPPLYYLLQVPPFLLTHSLSVRNRLVVMRLITLLIGAPVVILSHAIARQVFLGRRAGPLLALGVAAFVALVPQHLAAAASLNNDILAELLVAVALLHSIKYVNGSIGRYPNAVAGIISGLLLLTKLTAVGGIVAIVLSRVLSRAKVGGWRREVLLPLAVVAGIASLLIGPWLVRNIGVYGDPIAKVAHDAISNAVHEPRWVDINHPWLTLIGRMFTTFWVALGWTDVKARTWMYLVLAAISLVAAAGLVARLIQVQRLPEGQAQMFRVRFAIVGSVVVTAVGWIVLYSRIGYYQPQGRYTFPALAPIAILIVAGGSFWAPPRLFKTCVIGGVGGLLLFNAYVQIRLVPIIPTGLCYWGAGSAWPEIKAGSQRHFVCPQDGAILMRTNERLIFERSGRLDRPMDVIQFPGTKGK